jgi:glyoxylase-like metal-dependent hydrolase (beta-lactamase superfamily II)
MIMSAQSSSATRRGGKADTPKKRSTTAAEPDELVPPRYALKVGAIDVMVISDGVVTPPAESMATNADPAVRVAWLDSMFLSRVAFDWALNAVVVRSGGRTILVDSGLGGEVPDFPRAGNLVHRLEAAGIDLASVTDVVLTHMHFDHVGGLLVDGVKERLRPDLRIHLAAAEVKFWASPDFSRTAMGPVLTDVARRAATHFLNEYHGRLRPFEAEYRWRRGWSSNALAATHPGTAWSAWRPAATG